MPDFQRPNIVYNPLDIDVIKVSDAEVPTNRLNGYEESTKIAEKLVDHLSLIKQYRERLDAIDYLTNNAKQFAGNLRYMTEDTSIITSIQALGGEGNYVDLKLFEKAIDIIIQGYQEVALVSLTGVAK